MGQIGSRRQKSEQYRGFATTGEPAIEDMLNDPLMHAVMRRDGVSREDLGRVIAAARTRLLRQSAAADCHAA